MNWKNVLFLVRVERKSGRLIRGIKATRYRENGFLAYWPYWTAAIIGVLSALLANYIVSLVYSQAAVPNLPSLGHATLSVFVILPTIVVVFSLVFTLLQQIQLSGVKASTQVMYWLPITWQEHTFASIIANLLGFPLAVVVGLAAGVVTFSIPNGLILQGLLTALALFAAAFLASAATESLRILQVRFIGAVYKSSGRAAIWVRFVGSILFFIFFYVLYFYVTSGFQSFLQNLNHVQSTIWYVPFVWLAIALSYIFNGLFLQGGLFISLSALFIAGLYYLAVWLNTEFGLYEPPAITVQKSGIYTPKTGLLGKLGFSSVEAAIIRKDFRAFTRRRELISVFIVPIIIIIIPLLESQGVISGATTGQTSLTLVGTIFLLPAAAMAMLLGEIMIGEEGQAVWRIYASPISAKNLVKSKYFFVTLFSTIILLVAGIVGIAFYHPSLRETIVAFIEGFFIIFPIGAISLYIGFRGADFSETRRARMVRQEWTLVSFFAAAIAGAAILAPLVPYVIASLIPSSIPGLAGNSFYLAISVFSSGVISLIITAVFYQINISSAREFLRKAEV
jgi:hypothetical protein